MSSRRPFSHHALPVLVASLAALITPAAAADQPGSPAPVTPDAKNPPTDQLQVATQRDPALTTTDTAAAKTELGRIPGGASVVDADQWLRGKASTQRDLLGWVPGVVVQPRFGAEEARLSIRGSGIQRTFHLRGIQLLQDGFTLNQADGGGDFQAIEPTTLDHIEVYRGGNALRYGAATLGGAINYVSPTGRTAPLADLRLEAGSFGYVRGTAATGGQRGDLDWYVAASGYQQEGYRDHSEQRNVRGTANVGWRIADNVENRLYLAAVDSDSELPGALTRAQYEADPTQAALTNLQRDQKRDYPLYRIADVLAVTWGSERLEAGLSWTNKDLFHPIFQIVDQYSNDYAGMARFTSTTPIAGFQNRFTVGVNGALGITNDQRFGYTTPTSSAKGAQVADAELTATNLDLYVEDQFHVIPEVAVIAGVQATWSTREYDDEFLSNGDQSGEVDYDAVNPKLGVLWHTTATTQVFGNVSRSYEPPSFGELGLFPTPVGPATRFPTDIDAQSAWTVEVGTRGSCRDASWELVGYHAWVENELLSYDIGSATQRTINADETLHLGIEAGLDVTVLRDLAAKGDQLVLRQVYTWGRFRFDGDAVYGDNQIPGMPEHVYRVELLWTWDAWFVGPNLEWQSGFPVDFANTTDNDSYTLFGARAGYRAARGLTVFVDGRNLADEDHVPTTSLANPTLAATNQALYFPGDGLSVVGGVAWRY
jgi:iron complex outermembrane receptor protein